MFLRLFFLPLLLLAIASLAEADGGNIHITGNLTAQSCTVDGATDFTLSLGTVDRADLPSVGSTANQVGLNIPLSCISGTKVIIQIDGTSVSDNNTVMVNTGTAEGVGTQLLEPNNNRKFTDQRSDYSWRQILQNRRCGSRNGECDGDLYPLI